MEVAQDKQLVVVAFLHYSIKLFTLLKIAAITITAAELEPITNFEDQVSEDSHAIRVDNLAYYLAGSLYSIVASAGHNITIIADKWAWVIGRIDPYYIIHASIDRLAAADLAWAITSLEVSTFAAIIMVFDLDRSHRAHCLVQNQ